MKASRGACNKRNGVPEDVMQKKAAVLFALMYLTTQIMQPVGNGP